jgi:hypothetical protein
VRNAVSVRASASAGGYRCNCVLDQIHHETIRHVGSRGVAAHVVVRKIGSHDFSLAHFEPEKSEIFLIVLFKGQTFRERQGYRGIGAVHLVECPQVRIASGAGHHAGNLVWTVGTLDDIRETLVVVDVS